MVVKISNGHKGELVRIRFRFGIRHPLHNRFAKVMRVNSNNTVTVVDVDDDRSKRYIVPIDAIEYIAHCPHTYRKVEETYGYEFRRYRHLN